MAKAGTKGSGKGKKIAFVGVKRLAAIVSLLALLVITVAGIEAQTRFITIVYRSVIVIVVVKLVTWCVVRVLASYEEINSGKA